MLFESQDHLWNQLDKSSRQEELNNIRNYFKDDINNFYSYCLFHRLLQFLVGLKTFPNRFII